MSISAAGTGPAEQVTLHLVAAGKPQQHPLLVVFHPLGQHLHAERVAERHDRLDDGAGVAGSPNEATKDAIDLEPVEGKFLQIAQARIAGAEIVERDAHAERPQRFEPRLRSLRIVDQDAFGHFEHDPRGSDAGFGHDRADEIDQPAVADLYRRKIDRDRQIRPAHAVGKRTPQHDFAELGHQPALLGERNEDRLAGWRRGSDASSAASASTPTMAPPSAATIGW